MTTIERVFGPRREGPPLHSWIELQEQKYHRPFTRVCRNGHTRHGTNTKIYPQKNGAVVISCLACEQDNYPGRDQFNATRRALRNAENAMDELNNWRLRQRMIGAGYVEPGPDDLSVAELEIGLSGCYSE